MINLFQQESRTKRRSPGAGRPSAVMATTGEIGEPVDHDLTEKETSTILNVTVQTLRNMRVGYRNGYGAYPPKLEKDVHWYKFRESKRSPVLFRMDWINKMLEIKRLKSEIGL